MQNHDLIKTFGSEPALRDDGRKMSVGFEWPQLIIIFICILVIVGVGLLICWCTYQEEEAEVLYEKERDQINMEREEME